MTVSCIFMKALWAYVNRERDSANEVGGESSKSGQTKLDKMLHGQKMVQFEGCTIEREMFPSMSNVNPRGVTFVAGV
jgi:hypothetical protein